MHKNFDASTYSFHKSWQSLYQTLPFSDLWCLDIDTSFFKISLERLKLTCNMSVSITSIAMKYPDFRFLVHTFHSLPSIMQWLHQHILQWIHLSNKLMCISAMVLHYFIGMMNSSWFLLLSLFHFCQSYTKLIGNPSLIK